MHNYAGHYQTRGRRAVPRPGWRAMGPATQGKGGLFWKSLAIIMLIGAVIGIVASYWVGHCIQESLLGIAQAQEIRAQKEQTRMVLLDEQARLMQDRRLEALAAVQVGLYTPVKRQQVGF
ncbi:MAG: hypothetical protein RI601_03385 [Desulfurivibrionaceae bacterium]|nr:hypothetical protein [Desulfurivibrionaceae bacterium]